MELIVPLIREVEEKRHIRDDRMDCKILFREICRIATGYVFKY